MADGRFRMTLPDGREAAGGIALIRRDATGVLAVEGRLESPEAGRYFFQRQTVAGVAGELVGHILFDGSPVGWKVLPAGPGGSSLLVESHEDRIVCVNYSAPPADGAKEAPQTHPTQIPIPFYQPVVPLQSLPGATGVIYLDFDGETGPFAGWGDFDAEPATAGNSQVFEVWKRVAEDFQGFNLNVTTDRAIFDAAPQGRRQHVIVTPTTIAAPTAGGVAYVGSYNWSDDIVCWAFYSTGKSAAEVISHEVGHALDLSHDGRVSPAESYYAGSGNGATGWAPIMGVGYYENLTQWSRGEYPGANNAEDDLAVIVSNNDVDHRADDAGDTPATARHLELAANQSVAGEGIIERTGDVDAFRFQTSGGTVVLNLAPVTAGPNLDIHAELVGESTGTVVASSNPDLSLTAALTADLAAGGYLLKVRGTGRGDPLRDGYTDYGSLGSYFITGSVSGGVTPERFTIAENSGSGTELGTVGPRLDHGTAPLWWAITGGNDGGAFAIDPFTGALAVASPAALDFEILSSRWDDPADIELFVTIADPLDPGRNEVLRVVVSVTDMNEPPSVTGGSLTLLERTRAGLPLLAVTASDPDRFQRPVFSIVGGNDDGWFAIDPASGILRIAAPIAVTTDLTVALLVAATDQGTPALAATATVELTVANIADGHEPGGVMRTYFENIGGSSIDSLTSHADYPDRPDREELLGDFDASGHGSQFGSTVRGYLIPPVSGSYRFWISSGDSSQLRLSPTDAPAQAVLIASVPGWSEPYSWPDSTPQQSAPIELVAGQAYYLEALHKAGNGGDHIAVAWSGPGLPKQLLRGLYLAPHRENHAPHVTEDSFLVPQEAFAGQVVGQVSVTDVNEADLHGGFAITAGNEAGIFAIDPASGILRVATADRMDVAAQPVHVLTVGVTDDGIPPMTGHGTVIVTVLPPGAFAAADIFQQVWTGMAGSNLAFLTGNLNYPYRPALVRSLAGFDSGENIADSYGSRIRAVVIPPATGSYVFYLSSDDDSRLLLGPGSTPAGAVQIASLSGYAAVNQWSKYASQASAPVHLVAGEPYYLETLHKEGGGDDHLQVAWTGPGIPDITVIPAAALQPYDLNEPPVFAATPPWEIVKASPAGTPVGTVTAHDPEGDAPLYALTAGNEAGAWAIDPETGRVTVADPFALGGPGVRELTVAAQDRGIGGVYPLKTTTTVVTVTVLNNPHAPVFAADAFVMVATEGEPFSSSVPATDPDAGDALVFTKSSGPDWLAVAADGALSGTPAQRDVGENVFLIRVTDAAGLFAEAPLVLTVADVQEPPRFAAPVIVLPGATEGEAYAPPGLAGSAADPDAGDSLVYSLPGDPSWLVVAPDGTLSGTPPEGSAGSHAVTVRATDSAGLFGEATLVIEVAGAGPPLPWDQRSLGPVIPGRSSAQGENLFVSGRGTLAGRNDACHFLWQPFEGDGTLIARLDAMQDTGPEARAGIMIRDSLATNSRHVFLGLSGDGGYRWVRRTGFNGNTSTSSSGAAVLGQAWLRLVRSGDTITASKSTDGLTWTPIGSLTASLPSSCYFGLAVASGSAGVSQTAVFSHVSLAP